MICHGVSGSDAYQPSLILSSRSSRNTNNSEGALMSEVVLFSAYLGLPGAVHLRDSLPTKLFIDRLRTRATLAPPKIPTDPSTGTLNAPGLFICGSTQVP